jgi:hypothetical protein
MFKSKILIAATALALLAGGTAWAKVSPEEAAKLGKTLTPFGAEMAGNADGTIPAWTGGIKGIPEGITYKQGDFHPDPFADDKVLFTIDSTNVDQYADKLTKGVAALLKKYPAKRLDIYPTRRTSSAPQHVYDQTIRNATRVDMTDDGQGVIANGGYGGIPYPIPTRGEQVMYNHLLRWRGAGKGGQFNTINIQSNGKIIAGGGGNMYEMYDWYAEGMNEDKFDGNYYKILLDYQFPARRKGELILALDPLNGSESPRRAWQYLPGQRRVRRAPSIAYDTPNPGYVGIAVYDDSFLFNGGLDRFDWKLIGKKEMYVPYNTYKTDSEPSLEKVWTPHMANPDIIRWELHRVWIVEANLKDGSRHAYSKRTFYFDEDSWGAIASDSYDGRGVLWRTAFVMSHNFYEIPATIPRVVNFFDLTKDMYVAAETVNGLEAQYDFKTKRKSKDFTAEKLRRMGRR